MSGASKGKSVTIVSGGSVGKDFLVLFLFFISTIQAHDGAASDAAIGIDLYRDVQAGETLRRIYACAAILSWQLFLEEEASRSRSMEKSAQIVSSCLIKIRSSCR